MAEIKTNSRGDSLSLGVRGSSVSTFEAVLTRGEMSSALLTGCHCMVSGTLREQVAIHRAEACHTNSRLFIQKRTTDRSSGTQAVICYLPNKQDTVGPIPGTTKLGMVAPTCKPSTQEGE